MYTKYLIIMIYKTKRDRFNVCIKRKDTQSTIKINEKI